MSNTQPHDPASIPERLSQDIRERDRVWSAWEQEVLQVTFAFIHDLLLKNYPGVGWFQIQIEFHQYQNEALDSGLVEAFGPKLPGLRTALVEPFRNLNWRVVASNIDNLEMVFQFLPVGVPLSWLENVGWITPAKAIKASAPFTKLRPPPDIVRPNGRGLTSRYTGGNADVVVTEAIANSQPFPYEKLC